MEPLLAAGWEQLMEIPVLPGAAGPPRTLRTFFVVGAPRCGTTFISKTLAHHPQVCFSKPKETHYFSLAGSDRPIEEVRREFVTRYYRHLGPEHCILGEGTPLHLYSMDLVRRLLALDPDTRFVVAVRNPLEMVPSYHGRLVYTVDEDVRDFAKAWALQEARARGECIPKRCRSPFLLQYREIGSLGRHVGQLFETAGRERCQVVVFDDLAADAGRVNAELEAFLEIDRTLRVPRVSRNPHREIRHAWAQRLLMNPPAPMVAWLGFWDRRGWELPRWLRVLRRKLKRRNTRKAARPPLGEEMREELRIAFTPDVELLSELLGRDLGHWLGSGGNPDRQVAPIR